MTSFPGPGSLLPLQLKAAGPIILPQSSKYQSGNNQVTLRYLLSAVRGTSSSDVFVSGGYGTVVNYDGSDWTVMTRGTDTLHGIWGSGGNDVLAAGRYGTILHYGSTQFVGGNKQYLPLVEK